MGLGSRFLCEVLSTACVTWLASQARCPRSSLQKQSKSCQNQTDASPNPDNTEWMNPGGCARLMHGCLTETIRKDSARTTTHIEAITAFTKITTPGTPAQELAVPLPPAGGVLLLTPSARVIISDGASVVLSF